MKIKRRAWDILSPGISQKLGRNVENSKGDQEYPDRNRKKTKSFASCQPSAASALRRRVWSGMSDALSPVKMSSEN